MNHERYIAGHKKDRKPLVHGLKLKQLKYEIETWTRLLEFITEENIRFKNRISEILKDKLHRNLLEELDAFQNRFIKMDNMIYLLRDEIAEMNDSTGDQVSKEYILINAFNTKLKRLRNNMITIEQQFAKLKNDFNHFLLQNF